METLEEAEFCFPQFNTSCRKNMHPHSEDILIYGLLSCVTLITVVLNLLVIISIAHFRKLHTTTNLLLLSMAVSDFLVGFLQMPFELLLVQGCWMLDDFFCRVNTFLGLLLVNASVGTMVLISVDRYIAICDPMFYSTKVTLNRVQLCVCLCWIFASLHSGVIIKDFLKQPDKHASCYGECVIVINDIEGSVDLVVAFITPITVIVVLYVRVFVVALSQARAMRSHTVRVHCSVQQSKTVTAKKPELKAARTLGVVVAVFLMCFCPFYGVSLSGHKIFFSGTDFTVFVIYFNSSLNPIIYVFLYPWFRKSVKLFFTLDILQHDSRQANIL